MVFDPKMSGTEGLEEEKKEAKATYQAEEIEAKKDWEEKEYAELRELEHWDRIADEELIEENVRRQRRIVAEDTDRKEEDGGEYRPLLYP